MNYTVSIRQDDVISVVDPETMDMDTAEQIVRAIVQYTKVLHRREKPVLILIDSRPLKHVDAHVHRAIVESVVRMDFDRMAVFGTNSLQTRAVNLMLIATHLIKKEGLTDKIKLFTTQQDAEQWLKHANDP